MKRTFAGMAAVMALFVTELQSATPADACSIHLIVKSPSPRTAMRSARPADILLLGSPSHSLQRNLSAQGHSVEIAGSAATAKRPKYAAVMTDQAHYAEAKTKYGTNVFLYKDSVADAQAIAQAVVQPSNAMQKRVVIMTKHNGRLVGAGGGKTDDPTKKDQPQGGPVAAGGQAPNGGTGAIADSVKSSGEIRASKTMPSSKLDGEMFFGLGSASIARRTAITTAVAWLKGDASRTIVISGFADPSGTADANMSLSQSRADAVKDAIVSQGIDGSRIEVQAFGATHLKYDRTDGRNRRVLIEGK